jgi:hypothetical protein
MRLLHGKWLKKINMEEDFLKKYNNVYLNNKQVEILDKYNIDYNKCLNLEELIFHIEMLINSSDCLEDLEEVADQLSEFHYYHDTNK